MNKVFIFLFSLGCLFTANPYAQASEIAGIEFPENIEVAATPLVLNGAGLRTKFFVKVYAGGLYLKEKTAKVDDILADANPKRIVMQFIYDEVSQEKLVNAWIEGFENNQDADAFQALKTRLQSFNSYFTTMHRGDRVLLDYLPGKGTQVNIKGENKPIIPGQDFYRALLLVWLGEDPADWSLRAAMLGEE